MPYITHYNDLAYGILVPGKISMIIDMQFGSTGKGLLAHYLSTCNHIDISVADLSPNAGHTFYIEDNKHTVRMLPVTGVLNKRNCIYFPPSAVIDPDVLFDEIERYDIDKERIVIHPRAAVIGPEDRALEAHLYEISSTLSGTGGARARKILRLNPLAEGTPSLKEFIKPGFNLEKMVKDNKLTCLVETGQGIDLGLNYGFQYPNCTSRDVIPSQILANVGAHPSMLGAVCGVCRTYPIRVGNNVNDRGDLVGYSGDVYVDSEEISFDDLDTTTEVSSVTIKPRRVFTFSHAQYERAVDLIKPDLILLNFCNYINTYEELENKYTFKDEYLPTHVSYGPTPRYILPYDRKN